ncbi:MAG: Ig-like domain-containing protein [Archangium sp.]|nr:Ig-like domain-containing protein [Archangium sp.]MDP3574497.1 Ig-like domain-containing protein [Archangium sp.]
MNSSQRILPLCAVLALVSACQCGVNPSVDPLSLVIEPTVLTLMAGGDPGALTVHRVNGEDVTTQVTWLSGDESLARVEGGRVQGLAAGTLVITASLDAFNAGADVAVNERGASCTDGQRNGEESDVDCGGPTCGGCGAGLACIAAADCTSGRCVGGFCTRPAACDDGEKNGTESGIDCGGHLCPACGPGQTCSGHQDCTSQLCVNGVCSAATCTDGIRNGRETALDCGGPDCAGCGPGAQCSMNPDCASNVCTNGVCQAATCFDAVRNGQETGTDCGGPTCVACGTGGGCSSPADCAQGVCINGVCQASSCTDGVLNGDETDLDCGGLTCAGCATGGGCTTGADCASGVCSANVCLAPTCSDGRRNGQETGLDCGGPTCAQCTTGQGCGSGTDCLSQVCTGGVCQSATCTDAVRNGMETGVDCGGPVCGNCGAGQTCVIPGDCVTGVCTAGVCQTATCSDGVANGAETDVDCGGGTCPVCGNGGGCTTGADCVSGVCGAGVCVIAACTDGVRNGAETGLDCGGPDCAPCSTGQGCTGNSDCSSGVCTSNVCQAASCSDRVRNGLETATDCGGGVCPGCGSGLFCERNTDCASGNCANGSCGPAILTGVSVMPGSGTVPLGRGLSFVATAQFSDGSGVDVTNTATWTSSDTTAATISTQGRLQSLAVGTTTVQALYSGFSSTGAQVTITEPALDRLELTPLGVQLPTGLVQAYEATGTFSDGSLADLTSSVTWSSSAPAVASVSSTGLATGLAAGTTQVTATLSGVTGSTPLIVTSVYVTSISVSPASSTLPRGVRAAFTATAMLSDGTARDVTNESAWGSTAPSVATVSSSTPTRGLVTAEGAGNTQITAALAGNMGAGTLTVNTATLNTIQVFPADETVPHGFALQYGAVGLYSDGNAYDLTLTAAWSSTAPSVARVSNTFPQQGVVSTLTAGTTQIEAAFSGRSGATSLRVTNARLTSLSITPAQLTLPIGAPRQYRATGVFDDGTARDVTALVRWRTGNLAVASISNAATSHGLLTSLGTGNTTVTAALGTEVATAQLRVTNATLEGVSVSPPTPRIGLQGVVSLVATAIYTDGTALDVTELAAWTSSSASVARVRNDTGFRGVTVGLNAGTSTITASFGSTSASAVLTVTNAVLNTLYISPAVVRTGIGIDVQFNASGFWSDGTTADVTRVATWTSSLNSVAVISNVVGSEGLATTRGQGVTTIHVAWAGQDDDTTLTVTNAAMSSITVTPAVHLTAIGIEVQYRALATFSDGTTFDITTVAAWSSSSPAVASVSGAAGSVGLVTALSGGATTLTARFGTVSGTASLTVSSALLTGLTVLPASGIVPLGYFRPYTVRALFDDGLTIDITRQATWTTGSPAVANVGNGALYGGRVTGLSAGTTTVLARFGGQGGSATATVMNLRLVNIAVTPENQSSAVGVPIQLTATGTFTDGTTTIELDITLQVGWKVSPKKNGTVSNTDGSRGMVTMYNGSSSAVIHAQSSDPGSTSGNAHTKVYSP